MAPQGSKKKRKLTQRRAPATGGGGAPAGAASLQLKQEYIPIANDDDDDDDDGDGGGGGGPDGATNDAGSGAAVSDMAAGTGDPMPQLAWAYYQQADWHPIVDEFGRPMKPIQVCLIAAAGATGPRCAVTRAC